MNILQPQQRVKPMAKDDYNFEESDADPSYSPSSDEMTDSSEELESVDYQDNLG